MELRDHDNNRVLVVDDQRDIHDDFVDMLKPNSAMSSTDNLAPAFIVEKGRAFPPEFELLHAASGEEACKIVQTARASDSPIAVAYIDIRMPPGIDGIETTRRIREIDSAIELVIMTAYTDRSLSGIIYGMESLHKLLYIRKPFAHEEIQQITLSLVEKWNVEQELAEKRRQLTISHQRLESVLNATGDAMAMYDASGSLTFANQGYEKLFGLAESDLKKVSPDTFTARFQERFRKPGLPEEEGWLVFEDDGNLVEAITDRQIAKRQLFYRSTFPVRDSRGDAIGDLYVYRDVSKEIEIEQMKTEVLRLRSELETTYSFAGMVGDGLKMRQVYALMKRAVESDITVLIRGESGTGKEMVAKAFHFNGPRKEGPFLGINCSALPEALIESELFGHERGAFTGATRQRIGAFERAEGGTIFLDEIGAMHPALQAKLLRVLQEREIQPLGATATRSINVRVIAATSASLEEAIRQGTFREDLFYRLATFPIVMPPLRERREDIPQLADHFLRKHAKRLNKAIIGLSAATLRLLIQYDWPGNVRELENAIERAILLETTEVLQAWNLPSQLYPPAAAPDDPTMPSGILPLAVVERQALAHALEASDRNVTEAARALGVNRATLYRKLKKYDLSAKS